MSSNKTFDDILNIILDHQYSYDEVVSILNEYTKIHKSTNSIIDRCVKDEVNL